MLMHLMEILDAFPSPLLTFLFDFVNPWDKVNGTDS